MCPGCGVRYLGQDAGFVCDCPLPELGEPRQPPCRNARCTFCGWTGTYPAEQHRNGQDTLVSKMKRLLRQQQ